MKYFDFKGNKCYFYISTYTNNDRIYIEIDTENGDIWCDVTINLTRMKIPSGDYAFIDTANTPALKEFLTENGFATETGIEVSNHYNVYPLYKLNMDKIREYGLVFMNMPTAEELCQERRICQSSQYILL